MSNYAGETVRIFSTAEDYDSNALTPSTHGLTTVLLDLYDGAGNYVFTSQVMTWDTEGYWFYDWQSARAGTWTAKATYVGTSYVIFDYGIVSVRTPRVTPTGNAA